jgi:uncharacterized protein (DUF849 family)
VGVSTGAWIEPDLQRRVELIGAWTEPDYASVNVSEDGFEQVIRALRQRGIGVEAGVCSTNDARALKESALAGDLTRILIEPVDADPAAAVALVAAIEDELAGIEAPRLVHGDGAATWVFLEDAVRRGWDTRIGLEDTREADNVALVARAMSLARGERQ